MTTFHIVATVAALLAATAFPAWSPDGPGKPSPNAGQVDQGRDAYPMVDLAETPPG